MTPEEALRQLLSVTPNEMLNMRDFGFALVGSLLASIILLWIYSLSYGHKQLGAGVQRMFLLGGPAITALLLSIQFSLPLSLGLLGALSIVRFRTPVKDPAEIGFVLLLIAGAIGFATFNPWLVVLLYGITLAVVGGEYLVTRYAPGMGGAYLIVTLGSSDAISQQQKVSEFISSRLKGVVLESVSTMETRPSFHFRFNKRKNIDWGELKADLNALVAPETVDIYMS